MTVTSAEEWSLASEAGPVECVHALGAFCLFYNRLEAGLLHMTLDLLAWRGDFDSGFLLHHRLHNIDRTDLLKSRIAYLYGDDHKRQDAFGYGVACFLICSQNRNILLHAAATYDNDDTSALVLFKFRRDRPLLSDQAFYRLSLTDLRELTEDVVATDRYLDNLRLYYAWQESPFEEMRSVPWPEKPRKPRTLTRLVRPSSHTSSSSPP